MNELDALLHQPLRTQISAYLGGAGEATFSELKAALHASDGKLEPHLKKLIAARYIAVRRESGPGRPQSFYTLTTKGHAALRNYVVSLQQLLSFESKHPVSAAARRALKTRPA